MTPASFIAWRERLGFTRIEAARRLGLGRNTIARYETGQSKIPLYIALACAAIAYGRPPME